jgi:DNA-binding transcriptional LysR family regulator
VDSIVSNHQATVAGVLRLSAPPNASESLLTPLVCAFRASYPNCSGSDEFGPRPVVN